MRVAVCPGSFDPITKGHLDIIKRAAKLFDKVIVAVSQNSDKKGTFSVQERVALINKCICELDNVEVDIVTGLLANYVKKVNACAIVKGLRALSDFEYEFQMALANKKLNSEADTLFLTASSENMYLSSSLVKQVASLGGDISDFISSQIIEDVMTGFCNINNQSSKENEGSPVAEVPLPLLPERNGH